MSVVSFWYIFTTNGDDGFLLDLIRRPEEAEARLAVYSRGQPTQVLRERLPSSRLAVGEDRLDVKLGSIELDRDGCHGVLNRINLDVAFRLSGRTMKFVPRWVSKLIARIPDFRSNYGTLDEGVSQGTHYSNLPLVYSTYEVRNLAKSVWILITAPKFKDTDLAFEISAAGLWGLWAPSAYIYFKGTEYKLSNPLVSLLCFRVHHAGEIIGHERVFSASIRSGKISLDVIAKAPASDFVMLAREGDTEIHTTVFGSCEASITLPGRGSEPLQYFFEAERTCLLEVKNRS
jgi:hypothetical protein